MVAIAIPLLLIGPGLLAALYLASNVRTDCPAATLVAVLTGKAGCGAPIAYTLTHPSPWWGFNHVFGPLLLIALVAVPSAFAVLLEIRLHRPRRV